MNKIERHRLTSQLEEWVSQLGAILGPGLPLPTNSECLLHEMKMGGISFRQDVVIPLSYKNYRPETQLKVSLLIENEIPLEFAESPSIAIPRMQAILRHSGKELGFVLHLQGKTAQPKLEKITHSHKN
mgnify:CR=1 FL=1